MEFYYPSDETARLLLAGELSLVLFSSFLSVVFVFSSSEKTADKSILCRTARALFPFVFFLIALAVCLNLFSAGGREIFGCSLIPAGSILSRLLIIDWPLWLRRFFEPVYWLFMLAWLGVVSRCTDESSRRFGRAAVLLLLVVLFIESSVLFSPGIRPQFSQSGRVLLLLHRLTVYTAVLFMAISLTKEIWEKRRLSLRKPSQLRSTALVVPFASLALIAFLASAAVPLLIKAYPTTLVGAHYYSWFPEHWKHGYIGEKVRPPFGPLLGEYKSADPEIMARHLRWADEAGIDFFVFDWWPNRPVIGKRIERHVKSASFPEGFRFALQYESLDLRDPRDPPYPGEGENIVYITEDRVRRLKLHWQHLAKRFMKSGNYLRVGGRPVLFVYATRHMAGPVGQAVREARRHVTETTGEDLFLVADEAFFNVVADNDKKGIHLLAENEINWERLAAFDAVTAYNPYDSGRKQHAGLLGAEVLLRDVSKLYRRYRAAAATLGLPFFPGVLPGYNDRGVRPLARHYVVPRTLADKRSFFRLALESWVEKSLEPALPVFLITSWNEWNEGTSIEPTSDSLPTKTDSSPTSLEFTCGEIHEGDGYERLQELKEFLDAETKSD